ncbi:MAG: sugar ABC transporter ATP-binding protein, partial [Spirochaetaceae bacterium]|nr:sugar ABC transporter ATP-binding protein [Spirochaetaceae bacterium]
MADNEEYLLEMHNITKTFPGVIAVDDVSFKVKPGTVHALIGENGAGKSTLMKVLAGEYIPDKGDIYFAGRKLDINNTRDSLNAGISTVYQELNLVSEMTIAENMFLGRELIEGNKILTNIKMMNEETARYLRDVGLDNFSPKTPLRDLSVSQQQMVEIAKGIHRGSKLIVLDEPTSAITETEVATLFNLINDLKKTGITFVYISHKLNEIFEISDDITVMRDGRWVDTRPSTDITEEQLITLMVGREITALFPKKDTEKGDIAFEVKGLTRDGVFKNVSFNVRHGEILGFSGLMGAGRTEVARAIFGLDPLDAGEMFLEGIPYEGTRPYHAIEKGLVYLPEDRKAIGLVLERPIIENLSLSSLEMFTKFGLLNLKYEREEAEASKTRYQVKTHSLDVAVKNLSGGNQQKVVIGKSLMRPVNVLIVDEPTRGIDVGAKSEIHRLLSELAGNGMAIVMISSELPE